MSWVREYVWPLPRPWKWGKKGKTEIKGKIFQHLISSPVVLISQRKSDTRVIMSFMLLQFSSIWFHINKNLKSTSIRNSICWQNLHSACVTKANFHSPQTGGILNELFLLKVHVFVSYVDNRHIHQKWYETNKEYYA